MSRLLFLDYINNLVNIPTVLLTIRVKFYSRFRFLKSSKVLAVNILRTPGDKSLWQDGDIFSKICVMVLARCIHKTQSITLLCKKGLAKDAAPLVRAIFEDLVDLKYINQDEARELLYANYEVYDRLRFRKRAMNHKLFKNTDENMRLVGELQLEWDKVKSKYKREDGKIFNRWSGLTIEAQSNVVELGSTYDWLYRFISHFVHSGSFTASSYIKGQSAERVTLSIGASDELVGEILITTIAFLVDIMSIINSRYRLSYEKQIDELSRIVEGTRKQSYNQ